MRTANVEKVAQRRDQLQVVGKELFDALKQAQEHLDYCGYGDRWERECADAAKLPNVIQSAIQSWQEIN